MDLYCSVLLMHEPHSKQYFTVTPTHLSYEEFTLKISKVGPFPTVTASMVYGEALYSPPLRLSSGATASYVFPDQLKPDDHSQFLNIE